MERFTVRTPARECLVPITHEVIRAIAASGIATGVCTVFVPHTTAAVTINEAADPDVARDIVAFLGELVPQAWRFRHGEGNSDAHVKAGLLGASTQIPVHEGRLALGTWQGIFLAEFDGPRSRQVEVMILGERR